uniref:E3 ubiquitin-protein ligase n=1 Tax=Nothobranchius furzeri TaxID=105023 RepID=A0A8C6NIU4_NOTFU
MLLASAVVVWEWLNEHGRWWPYSPVVCHHIEAVIRSDPRVGSVVLGQVDSRLSPYIIDLHSMQQFRQDTGTLRPVRRSFYDPTSAPGQGCLWEWENDSGSWTAYDTEVGIAIQAARDRHQPCLDLAPLGFCYLIDFENMTQINGQTLRCRRIQRRSDLAYPLVSGPLPKSHHAWGPMSMPGHGGLLGVDVSGAGMGMRMSSSGTGNGSAYPSGALPASAITSLGQPCACQQCMLMLSIKAGTMTTAQTLGRRPPVTKPPSPKLSSYPLPGIAYSLTLPRPPSLSRSFSPHRTSLIGATGGYTHSLSLLGPATAALSISSNPAPPLISTAASTCTPSPSARVLGPVSASGSAACAAPLPPRSSLAGLSRPALQRIAMAQSRALIASGVPTVPVKNLNGSSPVHPALAGITGILMSAAGLPVCLTRPPKLVLHPPPVSKSDIKPVPGLGHCCRKTTKKQARKGKTPEEVVKRYLQKVRNPPEEDCTICMEALSGPSGYKGPGVGGISRAESVGRLAQCGHQYHLQCLVAMYNNGNKDGSLQCPTCKTIYGVKTGNQPPGKMEYHIIPHSLPGHPDCKTIRIIYNIPPGIQGPEHPNPGKPFTARGFPRHCYLPDSEKGRKVLRLLLVAWDRRLIFSVGTSSTTGESDTVIWNEVHHKTEFGSNLTGHGFPDPGHLDNVLEELRAQGITEEDCLPRD